MADDVRFQVSAAPDGRDFEVLVFVNGVEMTSIGAGMGIDPYDVFVPDNLLRPRVEPFVTPIARCTCGVYGCGSTDVRISIEADEVHWDWLIEKPSDRRATFRRDDYELALDTLESDTSWETLERTAGRLVLNNVDTAQLASFDLRTTFVGTDWRNPLLVQVALAYRDTHQIFLRFPWDNSSPSGLADTILGVLNQPPAAWTGTWHQIKSGNRQPPPFASHWEQEYL